MKPYQHHTPVLLREDGLTLMELIVVLVLLTTMMVLAMPKLATLTAAFDRINARSYLLQDLKRAQAETITQGCRGIILVAADHKSYSFGCDYLAYNAGANPSPDRISFRRNMPERVYVYSAAPVIFNSRGQTVDVYDIISTNTMTLSISSTGTNPFATGTLNGTGVFVYN